MFQNLKNIEVTGFFYGCLRMAIKTVKMFFSNVTCSSSLRNITCLFDGVANGMYVSDEYFEPKRSMRFYFICFDNKTIYVIKF